MILDTPYDFQNQVELHVPASKMPDPRRESDWLPAVCNQVQHFVLKTAGRALVLFTSYRQARNSIEEWRIDYNVNRPHTSLDGLTPNEFATRSKMDHNMNRASL